MNDFVILIPSYKPDESLLRVIDEMRTAGFNHLVIVDDGGGDEYAEYFQKASLVSGVNVLHHAVNRGKGAALKTGLAFIWENYFGLTHVLTVDADGQHRASDVCKLAEKARFHPNSVILGSRNFALEHVPLRSRFGNVLTRFVFRLCGAKISDTQTGLRAIPYACIEQMLTVCGERYEYETNVLLHLRDFKIPVLEVEIETVYIEENASSHFNPLKDSLRIYGLIFRYWGRSLLRLLKFSASSLFCTAVDVLIFYVLHFLFSSSLGIFAETICQGIARTLSSVLNFTINRNIVFARRKGKSSRLLLRYYALAVPQLILSALLLNGTTLLLEWTSSGLVTLLKLAIDLALFFISYRIQRDWVFGKESGND